MEETDEKRSPLKFVLVLALVLLVILSLFIYWFIPFSTVNFSSYSQGSNFSFVSGSEMQFYKNMRFPNKDVSYKINNDCPLQKKNRMEDAFDILESKTIIHFYSVEENEEISITCDSRSKFEGELFIAGEGGPTNITQAGNFNVILNGGILLIRDSECETPNIALHELLHVLGFGHSENSNNIMFSIINNCEQTIGEDIINLLNKIYAIESLPDLVIENASATMNGRYLSVNVNIKNNGLAKSGIFKTLVYADGKIVKEMESKSLDIGYGNMISLTNLWVGQLSVDELTIEIKSDSKELDKKNNIIILKQ